MRLADLPGPARWAIALFVIGLFGLHLTAQATLWATAGEGALPSADQVLWKYHGNPRQTKLHEVLDPDRLGTARSMLLWLDPSASAQAMERIEPRRDAILAWVEAGAPEAGWPPVRTILHEQALCLNCHGFGGSKQDVPLESYQDVLLLAQPSRGIAPRTLLVSAHNHLFGFVVAGLLLGVLAAFTRVRRAVTTSLVVLAFLGAFADVVGWFLTSTWGAPWQYLVVLGGALFGTSTGLLAALVLEEVWLRGAVTRILRIAPSTRAGDDQVADASAP